MYSASGEALLHMHGSELTVDYLQQHGFDTPILIEKPDGLCLKLPPSTFSIQDVENRVGKRRRRRLSQCCGEYSVPARLGNGQGAKEIRHNLARERPKFWRNLVRERNEVWVQFCGRSMKTWAKICKHFTSSFTSIGCLKTQQQLHFVNGKKKKSIFLFGQGAV